MTTSKLLDHAEVSGDRVTLSDVIHTLAFCEGPAGAADPKFFAVMSDGTLTFTIESNRLTLQRDVCSNPAQHVRR